MSLRKVLPFFLVAGLAVASARSYSITLFESATVGTTVLKPGDYKLEVKMKVQLLSYPADWRGMCQPTCKPGHRKPGRDGTTYCPAAGNYRNQGMAMAGADLCLAFPGGKGTADMVTRAKKFNIPVRFPTEGNPVLL